MKKYIGYYKNILEKKVCDDLIEYTNKMQLKPSTYSSTTGKIKNSEERVKMDDVWFKEGEPYFKEIFNGFSDVIKNYQREHKDCRIQKHCGFRLNKYSEGGFMSRHVDNIHHSHGQEYGYPQVSALLFLNDNYKGGEFIVSDAEYNPKQGSAIIFPSNFMFHHEVKIIKKGTRYSIVTWLM